MASTQFVQFQKNILYTLIFSVIAIAVVNAQSGPFPPRLSIPGAVATPQTSSSRQPQQVVRVRRPIALRAQAAPVISSPVLSQRLHEEPKPVIESAEDEQPDVFLPQLLREQQLAQAQQSQFQQAAAAFLHEPNGIHESLLSHSLLDSQPAAILPAPTRLPTEPLQQRHTVTPSRPANFNDFGIGRFETTNQPRFPLERPASSVRPVPPPPIPQQQQQHHQQQEPIATLQPQHHRAVVSRPRVQVTARPQYEQPQPAPQARPRPKPIQSRPIIDENQLQDEREAQQQRRQRPVAQTTRKWREENEDGSIVWGYENDDGSFKEEIIGTDCITKGTYGYIDPDGNKREYHYETGIKCDPNARDADQQELDDNGYVNYEDQRAVLPNGIEIDMTQLGKKKSKRPNSIYRN